MSSLTAVNAAAMRATRTHHRGTIRDRRRNPRPCVRDAHAQSGVSASAISLYRCSARSITGRSARNGLDRLQVPRNRHLVQPSQMTNHQPWNKLSFYPGTGRQHSVTYLLLNRLLLRRQQIEFFLDATDAPLRRVRFALTVAEKPPETEPRNKT